MAKLEVQYQPCGREAAVGEEPKKGIELKVLDFQTKGELKQRLNSADVVEIVGIFRGRQINFAEKRNVQLC